MTTAAGTPWRKLTLRVVALLLLGSVVTVAVAWGCAAWAPVPGAPTAAESYRASQDEEEWWNGSAPAGFARHPLIASRLSAWGLRAVYVSAERGEGLITLTTDAGGRVTGMSASPAPSPVFFDHALRVRSGWPLAAFRGSRWIKGRGQSGQTRLDASFLVPPARGSATLIAAIPHERSTAMGREHRIIPTAIMPIGFAVDTLFYAGVLWLLLFAPFAARRMIRHRRGRCPQCGYDLRGAPGKRECSECGWNRQTETKRPATAGKLRDEETEC